MTLVRPFALPLTVAILGSCRSPTSLVVTVTTNVRCSDLQGVSFVAGRLGDELDRRPSASVSTACDPATGHVGAVVVVPSGGTGDELAFRVTAGFGAPVEGCVPPFGPGCIVARRALRFIPHSEVFLTVDLSTRCAGVPCGATETCQGGRCVDPTIDPNRCAVSPGCDVGAGPSLVAPPTPVVVATVGADPAGSGTAQQQHIVYAPRAGRFWFFFADAASPETLRSQSTLDFRTFTPGATLVVGSGLKHEGRNFSAAAAALGQRDVLHLAASFDNGVEVASYHVRATAAGPAITFGAPSKVASTTYRGFSENPDGPVTTVASDGRVFHATGFINEKPFRGADTVGNMDVFATTGPDDGSTVGPLSEYLVHGYVPTFVHNRMLVPVGAEMLAVWTTADVSSAVDTSNLTWAVSPSWTNRADLGDPSSRQSGNDYSACTLGATAQAVRRLEIPGAGAQFEHLQLTGGAWTKGASIADDPGAEGTGVVLLCKGTTMLLFHIASDPANSLRASKWSGSAWAPWSTVVGTTAKRTFLSGSGGAAGERSALLWTEPDGAGFRVMGAEVTTLF